MRGLSSIVCDRNPQSKIMYTPHYTFFKQTWTFLHFILMFKTRFLSILKIFIRLVKTISEIIRNHVFNLPVLCKVFPWVIGAQSFAFIISYLFTVCLLEMMAFSLLSLAVAMGPAMKVGWVDHLNNQTRRSSPIQIRLVFSSLFGC